MKKAEDGSAPAQERKNSTNRHKKVTAEEIVKCYGTCRIIDGKDQCPRRKDCPWADPCLSRSSEEAENRHFQIANITVGDMQFDPRNLRDARQGNGNGGGSILSAIHERECEDASAEAAPSIDEAGTMREAMLLPDEHDAFASNVEDGLKLCGLTIDADAREQVIKVVERLASFALENPFAFDMLLKKIYQGKNQSDIARERGVTRQAVNKRLLFELGIAQKRNGYQERRERELAKAKLEYERRVAEIEREYSGKLEEANLLNSELVGLRPVEMLVYQIRFVDGCTIASTAKQLGISMRTVIRVSHKLRRKLGNVGTMEKG